jgi:hypothetical protein
LAPQFFFVSADHSIAGYGLVQLGDNPATGGSSFLLNRRLAVILIGFAESIGFS